MTTTIFTRKGSRFVCWRPAEQHENLPGLIGIVVEPCHQCMSMPDLAPPGAVGRALADRPAEAVMRSPWATPNVNAPAGVDLKAGDWLQLGLDGRLYPIPAARPNLGDGWVALHRDELAEIAALIAQAVPADGADWEGVQRRYVESLLGVRTPCTCIGAQLSPRSGIGPEPGCPVHDPDGTPRTYGDPS